MLNVLHGVTLFRFVLEFFHVNEGNAFMRLLDRISVPFVRPFLGLFENPANPRLAMTFSYLVAVIVFLFVQALIRGLLRLFWDRRA